MKHIRGIISQPTFRAPFVHDNMPRRLGFWTQVDGVTVHVQADPNMDAKTAAALQEMLRCAIRAIENGEIGRKRI